MKTLIFPKAVDAWCNIVRSRAEAAKLCDMFISDLKIRQRYGKYVLIVLWICSRARNGAHIDDEANLGRGEQVDEFADRARGMANGEERKSHVCYCRSVLAFGSQARCLNAVALCKAT